MITSLEFFGFLLVLGRAWYWEMIGFDLCYELFEMLVCFHVRTDLWFTADEELNWHRWRLINLPGKSDRDVYSQHIAWWIHLVNDPVWENTVSLEHIQFEERIEAVPSATGVECELGERGSSIKQKVRIWKYEILYAFRFYPTQFSISVNFWPMRVGLLVLSSLDAYMN